MPIGGVESPSKIRRFRSLHTCQTEAASRNLAVLNHTCPLPLWSRIFVMMSRKSLPVSQPPNDLRHCSDQIYQDTLHSKNKCLIDSFSA
ncbi:Uncharacterized protein M6B38_229675 [Iris pallida]|uniref:Uncharacterized protein n=1 Tax=Iris pallida TaxID=29817 RepID=A0AAX6DRZ9_IRIPA|nr:Uncharacterized protein M6B38_229675 [Iris pallida]